MDYIIGFGIAGAGAFYANQELEIFERSPFAGGLCGNFVINGFRFDKAVHLSFTKENIVRELFDLTEYYLYQPISFSWYHNKWLKHPAQNNLYPLPVEEKIKAVEGFIERKINFQADNFEDWTISNYGEFLYQNLFKPYNEKYWCTNLKNLGIQWVGNRFYIPTIEEVLYGSYTDETPITYYAKEMRYPKQGGYLSFVKPIIKRAEELKKVHYNEMLNSISIRNKTVYFSSGRLLPFNHLFSSVPLPEIINYISDVPEHMIEKASRLEYTSIVLVSMGLKKVEDEKLWLYIYDRDIYAARAYMPSVKSKDNVPEGFSSIQFEIYFNSRKKPLGKKECIDNCYYALEKLGIATKENVIFADYRIVKYGNIIFSKGTEEIAYELNEWLKEKGIVQIGRFGEWKYLWSDQALLSGYKAVSGK